MPKPIKILPKNHREIKTQEQQAFLEQNQGKRGFTEKAYFLSCAIIDRTATQWSGILGNAKDLIE
jgi:hypothetical protein